MDYIHPAAPWIPLGRISHTHVLHIWDMPQLCYPETHAPLQVMWTAWAMCVRQSDP